MNIHFATCDRQRALQFIQDVYPDREITDTEDCAGPLLDLVAKDILRIQDPMMHGNRIAVLPGNKWDESYREAATAAGKKLTEVDP